MTWYDPRTWFNQAPAPTTDYSAPSYGQPTAPAFPGGRKRRNKTRRGGRRVSKKNRGGKKSNRT